MTASSSRPGPVAIAPSRATRPWHAVDASGAIESMGGNAESGLSSSEATKRALQYGPNDLPELPSRAVALLFLGQFHSPLIYILFVAAALAAGMGHWGDALVILGVVLADAFIGTFQEGALSVRGPRCAGCRRCGSGCCATPASSRLQRAIWSPATSCYWPPATPWALMHA